jgi:peptidyl-prolyl cis-trans isomerase C
MASPVDPIASPRRSNVVHAVARTLLIGSAATLAFVSASCNKAEPKGQVVAVANGEEITVAELNEEARSRGLSIGNDSAARGRVMRDLVDRKLLAQQAVRDKIDRSPEHLITARRLNELLLAQELVAARRGPADPTDAEVSAFIKAHPHAFDQRVSIRVAQITVPTKLHAKVQADLSTATTLEQAQQLLTAAHISGARSEQVWDSANLPEVTTERLLPATGELLLLPTEQGMAIVQVLSVTPQPTPPDQRVSTARQWMTQHRTNDALDQLLAAARSKARVKYQQGFEPSE